MSKLIFRCIDIETLGAYFVERAGEPSNMFAAYGRSIVEYDPATNKAKALDSKIIVNNVNWSSIRKAMAIVKPVLPPKEKRNSIRWLKIIDALPSDTRDVFLRYCEEARTEPRCVIEYWSYEPESIDYFESCPATKSDTDFAAAIMNLEEEDAIRYPDYIKGSDNEAFDSAIVNYHVMHHHLPLLRSDGDVDQRLRPPNAYMFDKYCGQSVNYAHLAIGALMARARLSIPGLEKKATMTECKKIWWRNSASIIPPHDHKPQNDALNILFNFLSIVYGAEVPRRV